VIAFTAIAFSDNRMLDPILLKTFLVVAEGNGFFEASRRLSLRQSNSCGSPASLGASRVRAAASTVRRRPCAGLGVMAHARRRIPPGLHELSADLPRLGALEFMLLAGSAPISGEDAPRRTRSVQDAPGFAQKMAIEAFRTEAALFEQSFDARIDGVPRLVVAAIPIESAGLRLGHKSLDGAERRAAQDGERAPRAASAVPKVSSDPCSHQRAAPPSGRSSSLPSSSI
jgi:hypothetical protein